MGRAGRRGVGACGLCAGRGTSGARRAGLVGLGAGRRGGFRGRWRGCVGAFVAGIGGVKSMVGMEGGVRALGWIHEVVTFMLTGAASR